MTRALAPRVEYGKEPAARTTRTATRSMPAAPHDRRRHAPLCGVNPLAASCAASTSRGATCARSSRTCATDRDVAPCANGETRITFWCTRTVRVDGRRSAALFARNSANRGGRPGPPRAPSKEHDLVVRMIETVKGCSRLLLRVVERLRSLRGDGGVAGGDKIHPPRHRRRGCRDEARVRLGGAKDAAKMPPRARSTRLSGGDGRLQHEGGRRAGRVSANAYSIDRRAPGRSWSASGVRRAVLRIPPQARPDRELRPQCGRAGSRAPGGQGCALGVPRPTRNMLKCDAPRLHVGGHRASRTPRRTRASQTGHRARGLDEQVGAELEGAVRRRGQRLAALAMDALGTCNDAADAARGPQDRARETSPRASPTPSARRWTPRRRRRALWTSRPKFGASPPRPPP